MNAYPVAYGRDLARAYGYPPHAVELVGRWLGQQQSAVPFLVTPRFFEVEILEGVTLRYWHPAPFDILCHDFEPADALEPIPLARACAEYLPGGRCRLRPHDVCSEYVRAMKRRSGPPALSK